MEYQVPFSLLFLFIFKIPADVYKFLCVCLVFYRLYFGFFVKLSSVPPRNFSPSLTRVTMGPFAIVPVINLIYIL